MPPKTVSPRASFDRFSLWALLATIFVAIVLVTPFTPTSLPITKTFVLAAGALITLALYILARLTRGNVVAPASLLLGALWFPVVAYVCSALFSGGSFASAFWGSALQPDTLGFMLVAAVLGTLAALLVRNKAQYRSFLRIGGFTFLLVAVVEVAIVFFAQVAPNTISPTFSILGSFQELAVFIGLGIVTSLVALRFFELGKGARRWLLVAIVLGLFLLALANAPLIWILVALTALGLFVEAIMRHNPKQAADPEMKEVALSEEAPVEGTEGNRSIGLSLFVLAVSLFFLIGGTLGGALANSLNVKLLNVRPSWQSTFAVAQQTYHTSPVFGSGPNTFGVEWLKHRDPTLNATLFWNVDFSSGVGFIPSSFVTTGIVGVLAWLGLLGLLLFVGLRLLLVRTPKDAFLRSVSVLSFVGALYLFAVAIFDLPGTLMLALAFVLSGIFISTIRFGTNGKQWGMLFSRNPRRGFVMVFAFTIVLLASVVAAYALVEHYVSIVTLADAETALVHGNLSQAMQSAQSSIAFAPTAGAYQVEANIANARLNTIAASTTMDKATAQKQYQAALSAGINAALLATKLAPNDYQNWIILGNLYAGAVPLGVKSAYSSAKTAYDKAQTLNPTNPQIPYTIAQLDIAHKDTKAAEKDLQAAIALKQDYTPAIFLLSQLEVQDGNVKAALASALSAAYFTPNNPNILFQVGVLYAAQHELGNAVVALSASVKANPQFANARYFLAAVYAKQGNMKEALTQMKAIAGLSPSNALAVAKQITSLTAGKDPFPANLLTVSPTVSSTTGGK